MSGDTTQPTNDDQEKIARLIEMLDYVYHKLDEACAIAHKYSMDVETQRDMLDCTVTHLFNYLDENAKDI